MSNLSNDFVDSSMGPRCSNYMCCAFISPLTTPIANESINEWSKSNQIFFSPIIDATIKNTKEIVQAMDHIHLMHLEIEILMKSHYWTFSPMSNNATWKTNWNTSNI